MQKNFAESGVKQHRVKLRRQSLCCTSFNQQIVAAAPQFAVQAYLAVRTYPSLGGPHFD
jgi:hypothetical protein